MRVYLKKALRLFFFVMMVVVPVPVVALFPKLERAMRRNLPAETLKKD
ncbi:MAG: hypothetical protein QM723_23300 [Myxococcaceae bacterium]